ncbi:MAG: hypothetical protein ABSH00_13755 [Bryobacteraceae bacterium]|jgi:hypothetical protein
MADFRKWILALSVLALVFTFTGVASAQGGVTGLGTALTCQAGTAVPPQIRTEGYTELVGDITLTCTGGTAPAAGQPVPLANVVVNLQGTITSRLIGNGSEALLLIDEPGAAGSGLTGVGPNENQNLCPTPLTGCQAWVGTVTIGTNTGVDIVNGPTSTTPAPNVYQGVTSGSQVTFFGVPILAPVTTGIDRILRITNLRVNANGITGGGSGFQSVLAQISVNNVQVSVTNPTVTVGYIQQSFAGSFRNGANTAAVSTVNEFQCEPQTNIQVATLRFSELFGTAFKTRVNGGGAGYPATTSAAAIQNIPGAIYNSESGFISDFSGSATPGPLEDTVGGNTFIAGLADYGTRLKAVFSNIPTGVSVYVSTVNLIGTDGTAGAPSSTGDNFATTGSPEYAYLVNTETGIDPQTIVTATLGSEWLLPVSSTGGSQAVWEVVQALPNAIENYDFGVYITFPNNIPQTSGISATLSYSPTPTAPFSATAAGLASNSLTIPRFAISATSSPSNFLNINLCNTALLFPYVTTVTGFDTGISIANTTMDPFNTVNQAGTCTMYWYGGPPGATVAATNPNPTTLGAGGVGSSVPIISGTTALTQASQSITGSWSGYMIALCNFQYAHGYAVVTDVGVRNIMASYLALVINSGGGAQRSTTGALFTAPEALNN